MIAFLRLLVLHEIMKEIIPGNVKNVTKYGQRGLKYKKDNMYIQRSLIHNPIGLQKQEE